jgi:hypothetical protein
MLSATAPRNPFSCVLGRHPVVTFLVANDPVVA